MSPIPITKNAGVELTAPADGVAQVRVTNRDACRDLPWDRFVRMKRVAEYIDAHARAGDVVLDVGGYDGALALLLDDLAVSICDPETTGGSASSIHASDRSFAFVTSIDALEHIEPNQRVESISECARVADKVVIFNFPSKESLPAQQMMLKLTDNPFIRQHVEWSLPDSDSVMEQLDALGFACELVQHTSVAVWVGQFLAQNVAPDQAAQLSRYLIDHHANEAFNIPLYNMLVAIRR